MINAEPTVIIGTGERVRVRPWRAEEAEALFDILSRPEVTGWLGESSTEPLTDLAQAAAKITTWNSHPFASPLGSWAIEERRSGDPVGTVLLMEAPEATVGEIEIGWYLHPDAQGRGLAAAAAKIVLQHGFQAGLAEIFAQTHTENVASQTLCRRLGMTDLGRVDGLWCAGPSSLFVIKNPSRARTAAR